MSWRYGFDWYQNHWYRFSGLPVINIGHISGRFKSLCIGSAPWRTVWNECRIVLKIYHSLRTMLKICSMTNWNPISAISYAHLTISLHQLWEVCRVLLLRSNSFDDWPSSIAKRCNNWDSPFADLASRALVTAGVPWPSSSQLGTLTVLPSSQ